MCLWPIAADFVVVTDPRRCLMFGEWEGQRTKDIQARRESREEQREYHWRRWGKGRPRRLLDHQFVSWGRIPDRPERHLTTLCQTPQNDNCLQTSFIFL